MVEQATDDNYWQRRMDFEYYKVVRQWIEGLSPGESILDVGGHDTPVASWGQFEWRVNVNKGEVKNRVDGVNYVIQDFMEYDHGSKYSVVTCLQVMEHLQDDVVKPFAAKLLESGGTVIVSVPHEWPLGSCDAHYQDPVTEEKFRGWFDKEPSTLQVVKETSNWNRLVARFDP